MATSVEDTAPASRPKFLSSMHPTNWLHFIAECNLPFRLVEQDSFLKILTALNPQAGSIMVKRKAMAYKVTKLYHAHLTQVKTFLSAIPRISYTLDAWTSPNSLALMGNTAHAITNQWDLLDVVIGIPSVHGKSFYPWL
ncbi:uncharacterized protein VP01_5864g1 [Puccinia sorghi]|uniref:HAT C-terminal dimerisation domain-containing protein n=1 Tax=Puccinia sorghi TaxID=27349 RepID=A0A0L6UK12_9BASI|nr:uncharacterized protein VP01_5864g1 [Puccinia sorghi]